MEEMLGIVCDRELTREETIGFNEAKSCITGVAELSLGVVSGPMDESWCVYGLTEVTWKPFGIVELAHSARRVGKEDTCLAPTNDEAKKGLVLWEWIDVMCDTTGRIETI